jgi:hypothetical protein
MGEKMLNSNICKTCNQHHAFCKYPISHSVPTIDNIELSAGVRRIKANHPSEYTAADIQALNDFQP